MTIQGINPILIVAIFAIFFVLLALRKVRSSRAFNPFEKKRLLTEHELVMLSKIRHAIKGSGYYVCPQVAMAAVMDVRRSVDSRERMGYRNRFNRKIIDFVLMDSRGHAQLLIELDDSSHNSKSDAARDALTASAGLKTLRFRNARSLEIEELREQIVGALKR